MYLIGLSDYSEPSDYRYRTVRKRRIDVTEISRSDLHSSDEIDYAAATPKARNYTVFQKNYTIFVFAITFLIVTQFSQFLAKM